jgi:CheY-like chemotaxis protein
MDDTPTTLLVAERDESTREFLVDNLAADGYEPLGAQTEEETRIKLRNPGPALVVLGWLGNERRPLSLVRAIRSGDAGGDPTVPVILLGEGADELELLRAFEAGCDDFMPRPLSYLELRARVRACIAGRRLAGAAAACGRRAGGRPRRAQGAPRGAGGGAQPQGIRAPRPYGRTADPRPDEVGAPPRRVGVPGEGQHPHGRRSRLPAAAEARRGGRPAPGPERPRGRLPALGCARPVAREARGGCGPVAQWPCGVAAGRGGGPLSRDGPS